MGRKKKKDVIRCNVCGVKATMHIVGELYVCENRVCFDTTFRNIGLEIYKNKGDGSNVPQGLE